MNMPITPRQVTRDRARSLFAEEVQEGLAADRKRIPPKYFYDSDGSHLFEEITRLDEYYPTRTEWLILERHAADIAGLIPDGAAVVEFGSGACRKVSFLLDDMQEPGAFVPVDISGDFLDMNAARLRTRYPGLPVLPVVADFTQAFALPPPVAGMPKAGFFPGSTIGNFEPDEARAFLRHAARILGEGAVMIVGADRIKDPNVLHAAYNDPTGVTARFNLNLLRRINRELQGNFDQRSFAHYAFFNTAESRIEMHLVSRHAQRVRVAGRFYVFREGESIHTESSYKYSPDGFAALAAAAGWDMAARWSDPDDLFSVYALRLPARS
ncbi:MAG: L-histidine N(alpha)-methyltransferase [Pseudorhodoplanes sp.]